MNGTRNALLMMPVRLTVDNLSSYHVFALELIKSPRSNIGDRRLPVGFAEKKSCLAADMGIACFPRFPHITIRVYIAA